MLHFQRVSNTAWIVLRTIQVNRPSPTARADSVFRRSFALCGPDLGFRQASPFGAAAQWIWARRRRAGLARSAAGRSRTAPASPGGIPDWLCEGHDGFAIAGPEVFCKRMTVKQRT